jgi:hypothetical protein
MIKAGTRAGIAAAHSAKTLVHKPHVSGLVLIRNGVSIRPDFESICSSLVDIVNLWDGLEEGSNSQLRI